jgi:Transposase, Mutator family
MAASNSVDDVAGWLNDRLAAASPDLLRAMVKQFAEALMAAEADAVCGAGYRERSSERVNSRNGYRLPATGLGHPRGQHRAGDPETADGFGHLQA